MKINVGEKSMSFDFVNAQAVSRVLLQQTFDDILCSLVHLSLVLLGRPFDVTSDGLEGERIVD